MEVAGDVLRALIDAGRPAALGEIARRSGIHPSKVHRYLVSLARVGLVEQDAERGNYGAGPLAIPLAFTLLRNLDYIATAGPVLTRLRDTTDETSLMCIWSERGPVVLRLEESARPVFLNVRVGWVLPLNRTAVGRVFGAHVPRQQLDRALELQMAEHLIAPCEIDEYLECLPEVEHMRLGTVRGLLVSGVDAIAAPVFDANARIVLALGLLGHRGDFDVAPAGSNVTALQSAASDISARLGFSEAPNAAPR